MLDHTNDINLGLTLFDIGAIKFGSFTLKSGVIAPYYIDLRVLISYPIILKKIANALYKKILSDGISFAIICGVPCAALPLATAISIDHNIPTIFKREGNKKHGTKKLIEGNFNVGDTCLIIEDVVTSGISIIETANTLKNHGFIIKDACFVIDREAGGIQNLKQHGIMAHSLFNISQLMNILLKHGKISEEIHELFLNFQSNKPKSISDNLRLSFVERGNLSSNLVTKKLCNIINKKQSNLIFSADLTTTANIISLLDIIGPHICCVKTHVDIIADFSEHYIDQLKQIASKHQFLIMEDRKFADIGYILQQQYTKGIFNIMDWADLVTVHGLTGKWAIESLKQISGSKPRGCVLVAEMSSADNLFNQEYIDEVFRLAEENKDFVIGVVCQKRRLTDPTLLHFTPGVKLATMSENDAQFNGTSVNSPKENLGQNYNSASYVVGKALCDLIIVGRDIYESPDPLSMAIKLKEQAYRAYLETST